MRTKHVVLTAVLLIAAGLAQSLQAQENIRAMIKKCETDSVDMSIVIERDPATRKPREMVTAVHIKNDEALVNEFIEAFKKDEAMATESISRRHPDGRLLPSVVEFDDLMFIITVNAKENANVSMIEKYK
ncbi:MAG: DUF5024 domain-containing protein [Tannerellaceae bacterium]|jgi:hypothetical protein|nr:DUF5024 domain-containing protein [Tannerellaceae bacterium]